MTWWPGLLVLALALVAGLWWSWRSSPAAGVVPAAPAFHRRRPLLTGFVLGAVATGLVTTLVLGAQGEWRRNRASGAVARGVASPMPAAGPGDHPSAPAVEGARAEEIARLRQAVAVEPSGLDARRRLAVALLQADQLFEAFQEAQNILAASPDDFEGRMIVGVVRLAMGSLDEAAMHFDTVLRQHPENPAGYFYRGLVHQRSGDGAAAVAAWRRGVAAAGGAHAELEQMIAAVEQPAAAGTPIPGSAPPLAGSYTIHVELAPGLAPAPGAILFAALRAAPGGPPALVKRLVEPSFPIELTLTSADAMMGGAVPARGRLTLRLDRDGDASTQDSSEPSAALDVEVDVGAKAVLAAGSS